MPSQPTPTRPTSQLVVLGRRRRRCLITAYYPNSIINSRGGNHCNLTSVLLFSTILLCSLDFTLKETSAEQTLKAKATTAASEQQQQKQQASVISSACKDGLDFSSLREFRAFIGEFKSKSEEQLQLERVPSKCLKYRQAILELESLIVSENVCDSAQIDALIAYHNKYLDKSSRWFSFGGGGISAAWKSVTTPPPATKSKGRKKPITRKFFSRYAIQVAHTCKKNLIRNLETSRDLLQGQAKSLEEAKEKVFREKPSLKMNIKLIEEQADAPETTNVKLSKSETELTLGEYREALTRLRRPEDILTFERRECKNLRNRFVEIASDKVQMFFKPALICLKLAQYYSGSVLSIARLANYGYMARDEELDMKLAESALVKDWIIATQVCEPMLYMRTDKTSGEVAKVDTCSERVVALETMVFEDSFKELSEREKLNEWLETSEATRHQAQKIMKSAMKKLARVSLMRELRRGGKLKKRNMFSAKSIQAAMGAAGAGGSLQAEMVSRSRQVLSQQQASQSSMRLGSIDVSRALSPGPDDPSRAGDAKSFEILMQVMSEEGANERQEARVGQSSLETTEEDDDNEGAVAFDPLTSLASSITIIAIMLTFEWLFFVVMTLAARICYKLNFNFDNLLTFPPKVLSWSDADFAQYNENLEKIDEDDFFDYDELNPEEQRQRDLLAKVFGKPPPLLFKE